MARATLAGLLLLLLLLGLAMPAPAAVRSARAELRNPKGDVVGHATFTGDGRAVTIAVQASQLPPGFHGLHVHAVGKCDPPTFTSAGGHLNPAGRQHAHHAGDLPPLLVTRDGTAAMSVRTDRFTIDELLEGDGSALIVHEKPDNFAHIPDRYQPRPDSTTLATGDAGDRIACGVITP
jgi:superoxide dismutase, Cu-Zn family